jgi:hypothetical protein
VPREFIPSLKRMNERQFAERFYEHASRSKRGDGRPYKR